MEHIGNKKENDKFYLPILKALLYSGNEKDIVKFIMNYESNDIMEDDDHYMDELKKLAVDGDINKIEDMILSYDDYVDEYDDFDFDVDDESYEEELYRIKGGSNNKYEDEILSDDNDLALDINNSIDLGPYDGSGIDFEDLNEISDEDDFQI